jgi:hypothetical protein
MDLSVVGTKPEFFREGKLFEVFRSLDFQCYFIWKTHNVLIR